VTTAEAEPAPAAEPRSYGRGASILAVGIGVTGLVTYAYFSLASHALSDTDYGRISLLWSAIFITVSVLYRPVEQLLSRTIADRDARGLTGTRHLRVAASIQLALGALFVVVALVLRGPLQDDLLGGSQTLYLVLIVAVLAYAASYFARGFLAGNHRFGLYGALVFFEACSRVMFGLLAVVGVASGEGFVALGMAAAPIFSLSVVPWALGRRLRADAAAAAAADPAADRGKAAALDAATADEPSAEAVASGDADFTLANGAGFAAAVLLIMLAEQTFLNAGPLLLKVTADSNGAAIAGFAFNVLLIARAPLQLFQAIQTSILPHLTKSRATGEADAFRRSINITLGAIAVFAGCVAIAMLALGPWLMGLFFGSKFDYDRVGLVLISLGMGLYLSAATLNQAALARGKAKQACACWLTSAAAFTAFLVLADFSDRVLQMEVAYLCGACALCGLLYALYRRAD
jgi:O-antigen/teichoic acid export membrane protein